MRPVVKIHAPPFSPFDIHSSVCERLLSERRTARCFPPINLAEGYLKESRRKQLPRERKLGFLLAAAHTSWRELGGDQSDAQARRIYNASAAELAALLKESTGDWNPSEVIKGPDQEYRVRFAPGSGGEGIWTPDFFEELLLPTELRDNSLHDVVNRGRLRRHSGRRPQA